MKLLLQVVNKLNNSKGYCLKLIKWNGLNEVYLNFYVDSDHSGYKPTRKVYLDGYCSVWDTL